MQIIDDEMASELHRLARAATRVARQNPRTADFTLGGIQRALRLLVASFPVYRTYVDGVQPPTEDDRRYLDIAVSAARTRDRAVDPSVFDFLGRLLIGDLASEPESGYRRSDVYRCAMKFQQYCGPVMAKGVEDTAFYRYYRFVALNEVGGAPERFGISVQQFHEANRVRAEQWPNSMLATSTHDTKRGEDTRARLAAISTMPEAWAERVRTWAGILQPAAPSADRPDRNDRYLLFQLLAGTWPAKFLGSQPLDGEACGSYAERLKGVLTKSMREAKRHSTWTTQDAPYEAAMMALVDATLTGASAQAFLADFRPFMDQLAEKGAHNTFAQTVLKLTVPGMPDVYQGAEGWDLSMVDPDNRRPVDYPERRAILDRLGDDKAGVLKPLWANWQSGGFKLALTHWLLETRRRHPALFSQGGYTPLAVSGSQADSLCAYLRTSDPATLLVVAQRFPGAAAAAETLSLPSPLDGAQATSILTGDTRRLSATASVADLLEAFPASAWIVHHDR